MDSEGDIVQADTVMQKILATTGMPAEDLARRVADKQRELSGLVSEEGAAYIIAKELGLDVFEKSRRRLEIKNVVPGIKNLTLSGRVFKVFGPHEFEREGQKSAVANVMLADGSGVVRLSLWDQQTELLKKLQPGMAIEISGAYTKADRRGGTEIRLSKRGTVKAIEDSKLPAVEQVANTEAPLRADVSAMKEGGEYEVRAAVVQLFDMDPFFEVCPTCGARIKGESGPNMTMSYKCPKHGAVQPSYSMVLSGVIDDGTENIRAVFFRDAATALTGLPLEEAFAKRGKLLESIDVLGKEFVMAGRVKRNKMFDRLEFVVSGVKPVDAKAEAERLLGELKGE